jgi:hypothetical protein
MFRIAIREKESLPKGIFTKENLALFIASSFELIPPRGKGIVAVSLIQLFAEIAGKREQKVGKYVAKNGALKVEEIRDILKERGVEIGTTQLYEYLRKMQSMNLIAKRKSSSYGLKESSLEATIQNLKWDIERHLKRISEYAKELDVMVRK